MTGWLVAFTWFRWGASQPGTAEWLSTAVPAIVGMLISVIVLRFIHRQRRWYGWVGAVILFLLLGVVGVFRQRYGRGTQGFV